MFNFKNRMRRVAFTMAEILLSLTIIGVVAAITLPSLTGNVNERTWNTQRKALYARMSQAIGMMPYVNGYGVGSSDAAQTFLTEGLSKRLKINNICDKDHLKDCGIPENITTMAGSTMAFPKTWTGLGSNNYANVTNSDAAAFETQNGESIALFYNRDCRMFTSAVFTDVSSSMTYIDNMICANFVYDLNGLKGPNIVGKDIGFITVINPINSKVVAPMPTSAGKTGKLAYYDAVAACTTADSESRIANEYEMFSISYNKHIWGGISTNSGNEFWTTMAGYTEKGEAGRHIMHVLYDCLYHTPKAETETRGYVCVKR